MADGSPSAGVREFEPRSNSGVFPTGSAEDETREICRPWKEFFSGGVAPILAECGSTGSAGMPWNDAPYNANPSMKDAIIHDQMSMGMRSACVVAGTTLGSEFARATLGLDDSWSARPFFSRGAKRASLGMLCSLTILLTDPDECISDIGFAPTYYLWKKPAGCVLRDYLRSEQCRYDRNPALSYFHCSWRRTGFPNRVRKSHVCGARKVEGLQALTSSQARHNSVTDVIKRRHILIAFRTARPAARRCSRRHARSGSGAVNPGRFPVYASAARSGRRYCDRKYRRECGSPGVNARA
jgi:hypothetical protein